MLAAQFESFVDPFIIMITVPLALTGNTLNVYSQIGLLLGTLLTLFVISTVYTLLTKTRTEEEIARLQCGGSAPNIAE